MYGASTPQNTASLPACFVLKLSQPIPMAVSLVKKIQAVTEMECSTSDLTSPCPLLSLIIQHTSATAVTSPQSCSNKPFFVVGTRRDISTIHLLWSHVCRPRCRFCVFCAITSTVRSRDHLAPYKPFKRVYRSNISTFFSFFTKPL